MPQRWVPIVLRFEDEWDEVFVVLVPCAFGLFSRSGSSGVVVCVGSGVFGALAHSVWYADVDEVVPRVCGADNVHDGAPGLSPGVDVVELGDVLFEVAGVAQVAEPSVKCVAQVVVFGYGESSDGAGESVVSVLVQCV